MGNFGKFSFGGRWRKCLAFPLAVVVVLSLMFAAPYAGTGGKAYASDDLLKVVDGVTDRGLAVTPDGRKIGLLYDTGTYPNSNYKVEIYDTMYETALGSTALSGIASPSKIVASADGTIWMSNNQDGMIYKYPMNGAARSPGLDAGYAVAGFAFDDTETYIYTLHRQSPPDYGVVRKIVKATGVVVATIPLDYPKVGSAYYQTDIDVDSDGSIYIVDQAQSSGGESINGIYKRTPGGKWVELKLPSPLSASHVHNIRVDKVGNVYVNWRNTGVFRFTPQNNEKTVYSSTATPLTSSPLYNFYIIGIDLDAAGNLYVGMGINTGISVRVYRLRYTAKPVTGVTLDKTSATLNIGETLNLESTVKPIVAENRAVTWSSSDASAASVTGGVVTAKSEGQAVITVKTAEGGYTATCEITVENKPDDGGGGDNNGGGGGDNNGGGGGDNNGGGGDNNDGNGGGNDNGGGGNDNGGGGKNGGTDSGKNSGTYEGSFKDKSGKKVALVISGMKDRVWTGKQQKPKPTVKAGTKTLKSGADYTLSYGANKNIGKGTVTIKGAGTYTGTNIISFKINPKRVTIGKVTAGKKLVKATWKKASAKQKITGYEIQYRQKGAAKWKKAKALKAKKLSYTIKKLNKGKSYQVRVRTYKKVSGTKYYGQWSKVKVSKKVK